MKKFITKSFIFILLIFFAVSLTSCNAQNIEGIAFNTYYYLENAGKYAELAKIELKRIEESYSVSKITSQVYALNHAKPNQEVSIDFDFIEMFNVSSYIHEIVPSFNIAIFPIVELWAFSPDTFQNSILPKSIPTDEEIKTALEYSKLSVFDIDKETSVIKKQNKLAKVDFGAVAKGFAVDKVYDLIRKENIVVNIGGTIKSSKSINVGIINPRKQSIYAYIDLKNLAISTSGDYQRFYHFDGKRYHHIIGGNGYPTGINELNPIISVTVIGEFAFYCDALSTAIMTMDIDDVPSLFENEKFNKYSALVITQNFYKVYGNLKESAFSFNDIDLT